MKQPTLWRCSEPGCTWKLTGAYGVEPDRAAERAAVMRELPEHYRLSHPGIDVPEVPGVSERIVFHAICSSDTIDPLQWLQLDSPEDILTDVAIQVAAGAALVHALYHAGAAFVLTMPPMLMRAYAEACRAYRVTEYRPEPGEPA